MKGIYFFWVVFFCSLYLIYCLYQSFLMNLLIALLLCIATFGLMNFLLKLVKFRVLACLLSVFLLVLLLIVPVVFVIDSLIDFIKNVNLEEFNHTLNTLKSHILEWLSVIPEAESRAKVLLDKISGAEIFSYIFNIASSAGKRSLEFVVDTGFIVIFLFFFYYYGSRLYEYIVSLIPFDRTQVESVFDEVVSVLKVVCYTSIINIVLQGFSFGVAIAFFGYDGVFFGILYGFCSLIPAIGGLLVWVPLSAYEISLGNYSVALFIALYSLIFIAVIIDSVIKPILIGLINKKILKTSVQINELLIFFAIFAGLSAFGVWGIILGPIITALFIALLRVYKKIILSKPFKPLVAKKKGGK